MKKTYIVVNRSEGTQVNCLDYLTALRKLKESNYKATVQIRDNKGKYIGDGITLKSTCKRLGI